jgi:hypothetical protein
VHSLGSTRKTLTPQKFADLTKATDSPLDDLEAYSTSDDPLPGQSPVRPARLAGICGALADFTGSDAR